MATDSRVELSRYRITRHARDQMQERGIAPSELIRLLMEPENETPSHNNPQAHILWGHGIGAVVLPTEDEGHLILTLLLGRTKREDWEDVVVDQAQERRGISIDAMLAMFGVAENQHKKLPFGRPRQEKRPPAPVETSNYFDGVSPRVVEKLLEVLPPGTKVTNVRVLSSGRVEFDVA